jgi:tRNA 2-selenouridine synthase
MVHARFGARMFMSSSIDFDVLVDALADPNRVPIIDVRSPGEFSRGHIPGSNSVPLFDDAERAEIGTMYKQLGRSPAIARGLEIAESKTNQLIESVRRVTPGPDVIVHCWRGGMRSGGFAWLLEQSGFNPRVLTGGYKAFRRAARLCFAEPRRVIILGGHTGAGKTQVLAALREAGEQVIDLEGLAGHRGSAFGGIGREPQPTVEQFENELFLQWRDLLPSKRVWIEGESKAIGRVYIPDPVWNQMLVAPAIFVEVDRAKRVEFLVQEYGELPTDQLAAAVSRIKKRLGGDRLQAALEALDRQDLSTFATIALEYYDKAYSKALNQRPQDQIVRMPLSYPGDRDSVVPLQQLASERFAAFTSEKI